ncbi:BatA domain-containing protein [Rhodohalobacter sp. 8-1]|uniref:BatA domain-containing protein n=1 Tax=Rhodohalobacter sp. 8-1 TaxID=3131972 RepID=UPI0030ED954E
MSFLNPLFLIALVSVGIPLLIYLLNLRKPKRIRFSTLAFFESLKSTSLRKIKIKRWLLMAIRMLAVAALAFALAHPYLPSGMGVMSSGEPAVVGIIIDNSPSMEQIDRNGPYIEQAKEIASDIIDLQDSDNRIVLNVSNGESLTLPYLSTSAAEREVAELETVLSGNYLNRSVSQVVQQLNSAPEPNKLLFIISDGQESQLNILGTPEQTEAYDLNLQFIRVGEANPSNAGIDDVSLEKSEGDNLIRSVIKNYGDQPTGSQFLNVFVDEELLAQQVFDIEAGGSEEFLFNLPESEDRFLHVELEIEGDELVYDNRYFAAIELPEERNVLYVSDNTSQRGEFRSYLRPLLEASEENSERLQFQFESASQLMPDQFENADAIVLDGIPTVPDYMMQPIIERVQAGAGLLLIPSADGDIQSYNRLLSLSDAGRYSSLVGSYGSFDRHDQLAPPESGHPILEVMFERQEGEDIRVNLPELYYYYNINTVEGRATAPIMWSRTGNIILNEVAVGNGKLIYSAIGIDPGWSNFPVKPLFAPLFYRTVEYLASGEDAEMNQHVLGNPFDISLSGAATGTVELESEGEQILPTTRQTFSGLNVFYLAEEWRPGWKRVSFSDDNILFASNLDAMESELESLNEQELNVFLSKLFNSVDISLAESDQQERIAGLEAASVGKDIWYWFIIIAIILLLTESMISRHYKAETIS